MTAPKRHVGLTCPRCLYHPSCLSDKQRNSVGKCEGLRRRQPVAQRAEAARRIGVTRHTFYPWRSDCGGPMIDQAGRLRPPKSENSRPKRAGADLTLNNRILRQASGGNF